MDIKGIVRNVIPFGLDGTKESKARSKTELKSDASGEREGNGQAATGGEEQKRRPMTPEELEEAIKYFEGLPGFKDSQLRVRLESRDGVNVVYIEDANGKVVRRIPEAELRQLTSNREEKRGHLLNRAM